MPFAPNVRLRKGTYYARKAVPKSLQSIIGAVELTEIIGHDERSARMRHPAVIAAFNERLKAAAAEFKARRWAGAKVARSVEALAREHYERELKVDAHERAVSRDGSLGWIVDSRPAYERALRDHLAVGETVLIQHAADDMIERYKLPIQRGTLEYQNLCMALQRAQLEAVMRFQERDEGDYGGQPNDPIVRPAESGQAVTGESFRSTGSPDAHRPLSALLSLFQSERVATVATKREQVVAVRMFEDFLAGPKSVAEITKNDLISYKRFLLQVPTNAAKRFPGKSLREAVEANDRRAAPFERLSPGTINDKWLAHLKALLAWCVSNGIIADNPGAGVTVDRGRGQQKQARTAFSPDQLKAIFSMDLFTQPVKGTHAWALLLALYTGARAGELGQLEVADVIEVEGVACIRVHDEGEGRSVKTNASRRLIPLHSDLIRLGFLNYVTALKVAKQKRVFPDWLPVGTAHSYANSLPRWFNRTVCAQLNIDPKRTPFHAFRHTCKTRLAMAGVPRQLSDQITGHIDGSVAARYEHAGSITQLASAINCLSYPELFSR
ncbi:tyrosine-type recombinase/integrase [Zavarzinia sp. CC-PAN008]|uniref:tyrosine-type recombinase/integrase n=1 Tax=Zavarzinia sp. CC-PAN008 TaxID=3243332 RepID=UPI003F74319F